jgi:hypothetical protein
LNRLKKLNMIWRMGERADARSRHGTGEAVGSAGCERAGAGSRTFYQACRGAS